MTLSEAVGPAVGCWACCGCCNEEEKLFPEVFLRSRPAPPRA